MEPDPGGGCGMDSALTVKQTVTGSLAIPRSARISTTTTASHYLGEGGHLLGQPQSRAWVRRTVRNWLRVARTAEEKSRVMRVWREIHYLGRGQADPIGIRQIRISYYLDLPCLRPGPEPWIP